MRTLLGSRSDRRLAGLRPSVSVEGLIAIASLFFVATANGAFWSGVRDAGILDQPGSWRLLASMGLAIAGLHAI